MLSQRLEGSDDKLRVVLGQWFYPFSAKTVSVLKGEAPLCLRSQLVLEGLYNEGGTDIPLVASTFLSRPLRRFVLTPSNLMIGYPLRINDQDLFGRIEKINSLGYEIPDYSQTPLGFGVHTRNLQGTGLLERKDDTFSPINKGFLEYVKRLRLQVVLPESFIDRNLDTYLAEALSCLEARASRFFLKYGKIDFKDLYPKTFGPLPSLEDNSVYLKEGLSLQLPSDVDGLKQIRLRFILSPAEEIFIPEVFYKFLES